MNHIFMSGKARKHSVTIATMLLVFITIACLRIRASHPVMNSEVPLDAWEHTIPRHSDGWDPAGWKAISSSQFFLVANEHQVKCQSLLSKKPFIPLTLKQAALYRGRPLKSSTGKRPYLVRGIYIHLWGLTGNRGFIVSKHGTKVWVDQVSMGQAAKTNRSCLVIFLDFMPTDIFVTTSTAE